MSALFITVSLFQIFLLTDLLYGFLRREFDLEKGFKHVELEDGSKKQVLLD